ncbi:MAG: GTPase Era [Spirochaetia bacterium]|nr:GTPase Era [Spirochaetia bacterium]
MKSAFITVAGRPSAGKSTLINYICGHKVSIVSRTPQTTKNKIRGIYTADRGQFVFLDTPGYYDSEKKSNIELQEIMLSAVDESDIILYVTDMTREPGKEEKALAEIIGKAGKKLVIVLNKLDTIMEEAGDKAADAVHDRSVFFQEALNAEPSQIFSVSAKTGSGTEQLLDALFDIAPEGPMMYPPEYYTDQEVDFRISEIIREKVINRTQDEIPHCITVEIADMEMQEENGMERLWVRAFLTVDTESQKRILIGKGGEMIGKIRKAAMREIKETFPYSVKLDMMVKVGKKRWK